MYILACFYIPVGLLGSLFLLSGNTYLQSIMIYIASRRLYLNPSSNFSFSIFSITIMYFLSIFLQIAYKLQIYVDLWHKPFLHEFPSPNQTINQLSKLKAERDFWIVLICLTITVFMNSFSNILNSKRKDQSSAISDTNLDSQEANNYQHTEQQPDEAKSLSSNSDFNENFSQDEDYSEVEYY